ncbi:porin [Cupriavidus basilensis]
MQYRATPALSLTGAAYYTDVRNASADPYSFVLSGTYALSKRTDLYTILAYAKNRDDSAMGLSGFRAVAQPQRHDPRQRHRAGGYRAKPARCDRWRAASLLRIRARAADSPARMSHIDIGPLWQGVF